MKSALFSAVAFMTLVLAACNGRDGDAAQPSPAATPAPAAEAPVDESPAASDRRPRKTGATPAEIAAIEASGRTGLWAEPAELCSNAKGEVVVLEWNAKDAGADKVTVNLVSKDGKERTFGRAGPVGRKSTGAWARAGQEFVLRAADGNAELARTTLAAKQC